MAENKKHEGASEPVEASETPRKLGFAGNLARKFIDSPLTPLLLIASFIIGLMGMVITPREEDPQISVPMVDIFVGYPGASAEQVKNLVSEPLERLMSEISGVKHVYSMSQDGHSMVTVRFDVGQQMEPSLVKLYDKLYSHMDAIPKGVTEPLVKPKGIDDVPVVTLTLSSKVNDIVALRKLALDVQQKIKSLPNTGQSFIVGGSPEQVRVEVDPGRLQAYNVTLTQVARAIGAANQRTQSGDVVDGNKAFTVYSGEFLYDARQVGNLLVTVKDNRPVMLRDLATISQGERETKTIVTDGQRLASGGFSNHPAVTVAIAKKRGSNGVDVARSVLAETETLKGTLIPDSVQVEVTRNYGQTADEKVSHLIFKLFIVTVIVTLLMLLSMGRSTAVIVLITIPVVLLMTLAVAYVLGFTINRVSMFALVFAIGILVDDAIVVVENIYRRWLEKKSTDTELTIEAVDEVGNPTVLATFTVVAALLPMAFVSDMMGPFMLPIPVLASAAMVFSLFAAFIFVPWLAARIKPSMAQLDVAAKAEHDQSQKIGKAYKKLITPIMNNRLLGMVTLFGIIIAMLAAVSMFYFKAVAFKMLPMDNKSELNVVIDMPEGTDLFVTSNLAQRLVTTLNNVPEIIAYQSYIGTASPFNFNGLVRHYFLRSEPWQADIAIELLPKEERSRASHDVALEVRELLTPIAKAAGARLTVAETPPGPPVLASMVAEIYGPTAEARRQFAGDLMRIMHETPDLADINTFIARPYEEIAFEVDRLHAAMHGVSVEDINREVTMAMGGFAVGPVKLVHELEQTTIILQLPLTMRAHPGSLLDLPVRTQAGVTIPLGELGRFTHPKVNPAIFHKDLRAVEYVTADVIGPLGAPLYGMLNVDSRLDSYRAPDGSTVHGSYFGKPHDLHALGFKWDGEWEVTFVTFRDMGLAFGAALVLIYMLVVAEFRNFMLPLVVMAPIPLTLIGIIPGHWLLGADFTATSMIGFIALAGIIVRNSILLVDFAKGRVAEGMSVRDAVVMAAEVRMRPIVITALALVIGSMVLLSDPIFQGMAVSLLFGSIVATFLTLVVIPLGCFSARKAFNCADGDGGECFPDAPVPEPSGEGPSSGGGGGRPPRLAKQAEPGEGTTEPAMSSAPAPSGGRPPKLARKTEAESAAVLATVAAVGGRPPRLAKKTEEEPAAAVPAATGGRPPRLQKQADVAVTAPAAQASGRPPRLARKAEAEPAAAAPAVASGRPPRLQKQADVELPPEEVPTPPPVTAPRPAKPARKPVVAEAPVAPIARPRRAEKPTAPQALVVTPPPELEPEPEIEAIEEQAAPSPRPARARKAPEPPPAPEAAPVEEAPSGAVSTVAKRPDEQQAPGKRKLRGIRIKMNDDASGER
jgi:multidrug efflux pump subunit AcrB